MRHFFLQTSIEDLMRIDGADAHHIINVLRMKVGEILYVVGKCGNIAEAEIIRLNEDIVEIRLLCYMFNEQNVSPKLCLLQGLAKGDKTDYIIQKSVEIGVQNIIVFAARSSVVKVEKKKITTKLERWQKIANEAAKQCGGSFLTRVYYASCLTQALELLPTEIFANKEKINLLVLYEKEKKRGLKESLKNIKECHNKNGMLEIAVVVGPEGGLAEEEVKSAMEFFENAQCVTLGKRILRTETVSVAVNAILKYEFAEEYNAN